MLAAGEKSDSLAIVKALAFLRKFGPEKLRNTYAISLQTMVYATAEPERDRARIAANVAWLERAQIKKGDRVSGPGSWTYSETKRTRSGDGSNTHFAMLGLQAGSEAGVSVRPEIWSAAREFWKNSQKRDGGWAYSFAARSVTSSMTCQRSRARAWLINGVVGES